MSEGLILVIKSMAGPVMWVLIHSLWLGGLLTIGLAITMHLLRGKTPQLRYAVACLALLMVMPMSVSIVAYDTVSRNVMTHSNASGSIADDTLVDGQTKSAATTQNSASTWTKVGLLKDLTRNQTAPWILLVWLTGVSSMLFYHLAGWWRARKLIRSDSSRVPPVWQERFQRLCQRAGVSPTTKLLSCAVTRMPCVVGFIKPTILLPVSLFSGLDSNEIEMILAHELAHVRRYDVLVNYIQTAIETVLFFNPAVWYISRKIRIEREHCCDDLAVAICGDKVAYARALANLEALRTWQPRLAPAANGASLLKRIHRLTGTAGNKRRRPGLSVVSALTLVAVLTIGFSISAAFSPQNAPAVAGPTAATYQEQDDDIHGYWEIEPNEGRVSLTMRFERRGGRTTSTYYDDDFTGFKEGSDIQFQMIRDAGTFFFEGDVEEDDGEYWGEGECHFRSNPDYVDEMEKLGYRIRSTRDIWNLAIHNVELDFVNGIHDAGYDRLSLRKLLELRIHRVTPEFIAEVAELGYTDLDLDQLVAMRIHKVTPEFISEVEELGYTDLDLDRLVAMRIHKVTPEFISEVAELGYTDLDLDRLVAMRIHRVTPEFIGELEELGYTDLDLDRLVAMRIHRVTPEFIDELEELGYTDLDLDRLVAMRIHRVTPEFIDELEELGYTDLDLDRLVEMRIHRVSPQFVKELKEFGYNKVKPSRLVEMQIHGVDVDYIRRMVELGLTNIQTSDLVSMRIHGVSSRYVSSLIELGYTDLKPEDLVAMRIHDVSASFIEEMQDRGYDDLSPDDLIDIKIHGTNRRHNSTGTLY